MTIIKFIEDGTTAGLSSLGAGAIVTPDPGMWQTVYIPLITGLVAPLVKELILYLRAKRKQKEAKDVQQNERGEDITGA